MTDLRLRYPVYVPTKGRFESALTIKCLQKHGTPFRAVIEESEYDDYARIMPEDDLLVLPFQDRGLFAARNWIKEHSTAEGHKRHWQLDDNMRYFRRLYGRRRIPCDPELALGVCEELTERYTNVWVSGLNYTMFAIGSGQPGALPPFHRNMRVYSCSLILNEMPLRWRLAYNDDTDLCLQVLARGMCTILVNAFTVDKMRTMTVKGGNNSDSAGAASYLGDGRIKMARALERVWPGVVTTKRRFNRPQHVVKNSWRKFDTPLIRRDDLDWNVIEAHDAEAKIELREVAPVKSEALKQWIDGGAPLE